MSRPLNHTAAMTGPIEIRRAGGEEVATLVGLMAEFYAESAYSLDLAWAEASFRKLLGDECLGAAWIARENDRPAGYVVLVTRHSMETGGIVGVVDDLYVRPGFRRRGHASMLLDALIQECGRRGAQAIEVEVGADNGAARTLYERCGLRNRGHLLLYGRLERADENT